MEIGFKTDNCLQGLRKFELENWFELLSSANLWYIKLLEKDTRLKFYQKLSLKHKSFVVILYTSID